MKFSIDHENAGTVTTDYRDSVAVRIEEPICQWIRKLRFEDGFLRIAADAFHDCLALEEVEFPDSLEEIGDNAFRNCPQLKSVRFGARVVKIGAAAFEGCRSLSEIQLPPMLAVIENCAFRGCRSLSDIVLPGSLQKVGFNAFSECASLRSATISLNMSTREWHSLYCSRRSGYFADPEPIFGNCANLRRVVVTEGVTAIPQDAFKGCAAIEELVLPDSCVSVPEEFLSGIPQYRGKFRCVRDGKFLVSAVSISAASVIPDSVEKIGHGALRGCDLGLVRFNATSRLKQVDSEAFRGCKGIVAFPPSLRSFADLKAAEHVILPYGCIRQGGDHCRRYHDDDYALMSECVGEARDIVLRKHFDVHAFMAVVDRFMTVRMTEAGFDKLRVLLDQVPKLSRLQTADAFYGVGEADFGRYLDIVLARVGNLRRTGGLLRFAAHALSDERGLAGSGRARKLALVRRLLPQEEVDCPRGRSIRDTYCVWPLLTEAGMMARGISCEDAFKDWKTKAERRGNRWRYDKDEVLEETIRSDAASRFMIRLDLLAREVTKKLIGALEEAGAVGCLYQLQRMRRTSVELPSVDRLLTSVCDLAEEKNVCNFISLLVSNGERPWQASAPASGFGYLWHALCGRGNLSKRESLRNAATDALIAAGCDPTADCFCGFSFDEIVTAPRVVGDWESGAVTQLELPETRQSPMSSATPSQPIVSLSQKSRLPGMAAAPRPLPIEMCFDVSGHADAMGNLKSWVYGERSDIVHAWIPASVRSIGSFAFKGCPNLEDVYFAAEDGDPLEIGTLAFAGCPKLKRVVLPGRLKSIGAGAFRDNPSLVELTLDPGKTPLLLGGHLFDNCPDPSALRKVLDDENQYR